MVQLVVGKVETLKLAEQLLREQHNKLTKLLEEALVNIDRGSDKAKDKLEGFIQRVEHLRDKGELTTSSATDLISAARRAIAAL